MSGFECIECDVEVALIEVFVNNGAEFGGGVAVDVVVAEEADDFDEGVNVEVDGHKGFGV
jgi:hypothetical protein